MNFILNNEPVEIHLENEKTIKDFLNNFETYCENNNATIIGIKIDDSEILADQIERANELLIENIKKIEITTVCLSDILESFKRISELINKLSPKLDNVSIDLQNGKDVEVSRTITEFTNLFDYFCRIITLSQLFPEQFANFKINSMTALDFLKDFSSILSDFENALKQKDTVLIGDLCEYEILPRIQSINDSILPIIAK